MKSWDEDQYGLKPPESHKQENFKGAIKKSDALIEYDLKLQQIRKKETLLWKNQKYGAKKDSRTDNNFTTVRKP